MSFSQPLPLSQRRNQNQNLSRKLFLQLHQLQNQHLQPQQWRRNMATTKSTNIMRKRCRPCPSSIARRPWQWKRPLLTSRNTNRTRWNSLCFVADDETGSETCNPIVLRICIMFLVPFHALPCAHRV